jgi:hypothetical protein
MYTYPKYKRAFDNLALDDFADHFAECDNAFLTALQSCHYRVNLDSTPFDAVMRDRLTAIATISTTSENS